MSRLPGDRNSQQQPQQHNQIQQIIQPIQQQPLQINRNPASLQHQQQPVLAIPSSGSLIIINNNSGSLSTNDGILRTPSNVVNSIYYTTPTAAVTAPSANQNLSTNATSVPSQSIPTIHLDPTSPIAKKRLKLEAADSSSSCGSTNTTEDLFSLKKLITEHKLQRFKGLKDR